MERKIVKKWIWVWEFDKEEQWLNEMAAKGLALVDVGWCKFVFEECTPGAYQVRLELLENQLNHPESQQYIRFIEETGAEQVGSFMRWVYFRKKTTDGPFDLYSDLDSRIAHLDRMCQTMKILGIANLVIGLANSLNPVVDFGWVNLLCATLLMYALGRLEGKREALEKDRLLME